MIGKLVASLVFMRLVNDSAEEIGCAVAAKSILRLDRTSKGVAALPYIIVGTFASLTRSNGITLAGLRLLSHLPPLGMPPATP